MSDPASESRPDAAQLAAWRALLTAHATAVGAIERDLAAADLIPLTWYDVLVALSEAPEERLRLYELADRVLLSRSGLTRLVDRLERAGLLSREPCPGDRRGAYAALTEAGKATLRQVWPAYARGIVAYFARYVSADEAAVLTAALGRVAARDAAGTEIQAAGRG
jgi:DNA-binding MarR family transcriptional regulator